MKTVKVIFTAILVAIAFLVATSCQKSNIKNPVNQKYISVSNHKDSETIIDSIKVNDSLVVFTAGTNFPLPANQIAIVAPNVNGEKISVVTVYLKYVAGETIVFTDTYGNVRYVTFDASSDNGYVRLGMPVGFGTQGASIEIFHTYNNEVVIPDLSAGSGEPGYTDPTTPVPNY